MRRPSLSQMQEACDRFNAAHAVGDEITVYSGLIGENPRRVQVRYPAQILSGHTAVVYVTGGSGCIALTHVAKATSDPSPSGEELGATATDQGREEPK